MFEIVKLFHVKHNPKILIKWFKKQKICINDDTDQHR